MANSMDR